jgi:hypothetical protein
MIMSGSKAAVLQAVQRVDIHGTLFYDLVYTHEGEAQPRQVRMGAESVYTDPKPGDKIHVSYLMNVATGVVRPT